MPRVLIMQLLIQTFSGEVKGQWWQHNSKLHSSVFN